MRLASIVPASIGVAAVLVLSVTGVAVSSPPAAQTAEGVTVCEGEQHNHYDPSLSTAPENTTITADVALDCVSSDAAITAGSAHYRTTVSDASCSTLVNPARGSITFTWSDGVTSTFSYTRSTTNANGQIVSTATGTITEGRFVGQSAVQVLVLPTAAMTDCLDGGLADASGPTSFEIVPL